MTRTSRRTTKDKSARRNVPEKQGSSAAYPGRKTKGALCQMSCENLATGTMDVGLPFKVAVCGEAECREAARRLGEAP